MISLHLQAGIKTTIWGPIRVNGSPTPLENQLSQTGQVGKIRGLTGGISMCELCQKHGEGKKWFLRAGNHAGDLLSDLRRRTFIRDFSANQRNLIGAPEPLDRYDAVPGPLKPLVRRFIEHRLRADHHGQVVTLAEAREIMTFMNSIHRLPCVCRRIIFDTTLAFDVVSSWILRMILILRCAPLPLAFVLGLL